MTLPDTIAVAGQPDPRTGVIIGAPDIDRQQREAFYKLNPGWRPRTARADRGAGEVGED